MSTHSPEELAAALRAVSEYGGIRAAARALGVQRTTFQSRVRAAEARLRPSQAPEVAPDPSLRGRILAAVKRGIGDLATIAEAAKTTKGMALDALEAMHAEGMSLHQHGDSWSYSASPALGTQRPTSERQLVSDKHGLIRIAVATDTHLCSKYERLDCLNDFYDQVAMREISTVLHAGNWVDGEHERINRHDLLVHGMDAQLQYLARHYPQRAGVETWAITGADHEGWWARTEGVDVGRYAANVMRDAGRRDWYDMGYMECYIPLVHAATGASSMLMLMHPGGGSAYAISYAPQKIVEGFDGGEKPAALILGHYHKSGYNLIRNVHTAQCGTFQDQTVFMRQKKLAAHVGGAFLEYQLDPETGAILECGFRFRNYFVKGYYEGRFSQHGPAVSAPRSAIAG